MTAALYLDDAYLRSTTARVVESGPEGIVLDRTILYAESGGQPGDQGTLRSGSNAWRVSDAQWRGREAIVHKIDPASEPLPPVGTEVAVEVDWTRRYPLMRHHTAVHVLSAVVGNRWGALFTGGQLYPEKARLDCEFKEWKPEMLTEIQDAVNEVLAKDLPVTHRTIPRAEYDAGGYSRLRDVKVDETIQEIRLTIIGTPPAAFDTQADGGTHVQSTREVGRVVVDKSENKGKGHRRLALHVDPP
ncbi:MAG: alanyl-tRNA editing protein [Thermoplasmatota archaeon]